MSAGSANTGVQDTLLHELCKGWGAIMSRAKQGDFGIEACKQNDRGNLPLHAAASFKATPEVMDALIKAFPAGPSTANLIGNLPLHHACMWKAPIECVESLLERHPTGVRHRNQYGSLPLHMAASNEAPVPVIKVLIEAYPEALNDRNDDGMTPHDLAKAEGSSEIILALLEGRPPPPELSKRQQADQFAARADELEAKLAALGAAQERQREDLRLAVGAVLEISDRFPSALFSVGVNANDISEGGDVLTAAANFNRTGQGGGDASASSAIAPTPTETDRLEDFLSKMVGMVAVKNQIRGLRRSLELDELRERSGIRQGERSRAPHMVFVGNPGTGKTAVAKMLSRVLYDLRATRKNNFVEVDRMDLVRRDVQRTEAATSEVIEDAQGGILFVDEASALAMGGRSRRGLVDTGSTAITTIAQCLPNRDPLVILSGFPVEMRKFLAEESALKKDFPILIEFPDYTCDELAQIFVDMANVKGFELSTGLNVDAVADLVEEETTESWRSERNGRVCELLLAGVRTQIRRRCRAAAFDEEVDPHIIIREDILHVAQNEFK